MKAPGDCRNLEDVRAAVNAIDRDLVKLLGKRAKYAMAALRFKTDLSEIAVPAHRKRLFAQRREWAAAQGVNQKMVQAIFQAIVDESRRLHLAGFRARRKTS
ncbi:MAG TPA: chorismate mutase [Burkholderiales bacterium]|nr:chorismate mutase [Burkholderiales bacterium]